MNIALKEALPSQYSDKTILFTEMFGGTGNIEDPYGNGYSAYLETFELIDYLIKENIDKLCLWGERRIREK